MNYLPFAFNPKEIDFVLLTHAHIDHCGLIPKLFSQGFS
jgi:metallo-beta-lactamase family protein